MLSFSLSVCISVKIRIMGRHNDAHTQISYILVFPCIGVIILNTSNSTSVMVIYLTQTIEYRVAILFFFNIKAKHVLVRPYVPVTYIFDSIVFINFKFGLMISEKYRYNVKRCIN